MCTMGDVIYHKVKFNTGDQVLCIQSGTAKHKQLAIVIDVTVGSGTVCYPGAALPPL